MEINSGKNKKPITTEVSRAIWNIKTRVFDSTFELSYPPDFKSNVWELKMILN
jgi:hypothetical protein